MTWRLVTLSACFLATSAYGVHAMRPEIVPLREPLSNLTNHIGRWQGQEAPKFDEKVIAILGVEDLINRFYVAPGEPGISLYVGYYQSQREGDTIHSPMNCLPGSGWQRRAVRDPLRRRRPAARGRGRGTARRRSGRGAPGMGRRTRPAGDTAAGRRR